MLFSNYFLFTILSLLTGWDGVGVSASSKTLEVEIPQVEVAKAELILHPLEGKWYFDDNAFSGLAVDYHSNGMKSEEFGYYIGKKEGTARKWYANGELQKEAYYQENQLKGVVRVWSPSPERTLVSESNYVDGKRHGLQRRWFSSGQLQRSTHFNMGLEEGMQQAWLENGKIYVNYEAKNGRTFGLRKATLCYELDDEKIK